MEAKRFGDKAYCIDGAAYVHAGHFTGNPRTAWHRIASSHEHEHDSLYTTYKHQHHLRHHQERKKKQISHFASEVGGWMGGSDLGFREQAGRLQLECAWHSIISFFFVTPLQRHKSSSTLIATAFAHTPVAFPISLRWVGWCIETGGKGTKASDSKRENK